MDPYPYLETGNVHELYARTMDTVIMGNAVADQDIKANSARRRCYFVIVIHVKVTQHVSIYSMILYATAQWG